MINLKYFQKWQEYWRHINRWASYFLFEIFPRKYQSKFSRNSWNIQPKYFSFFISNRFDSSSLRHTSIWSKWFICVCSLSFEWNCEIDQFGWIFQSLESDCCHARRTQTIPLYGYFFNRLEELWFSYCHTSRTFSLFSQRWDWSVFDG